MEGVSGAEKYKVCWRMVMMMVSLTKFHIPHPVIGVRVVARVWLARVRLARIWLARVWCWLFEIHLKGVAAIEVGAGDALESGCEGARIVYSVSASVLLHKSDAYLMERFL